MDRFVNRDEIQRLFRDIVKERGFHGHTVELCDYDSNGIVGVNSVIKIKCERDQEVDEIKLFAKTAPTAIECGSIINDFFAREIFLYTKVIPIIEELQNEIAPKGFSKIPFAKYYGSNIENNDQFLLLEYLEGYTVLPVHPYLSTETELALTIKTIAKFHALSLVFKKRNPELFERIAMNLLNIPFNGHFNTTKSFIRLGYERTMLTLKNEGHKNTLKKLFDDDHALIFYANLLNESTTKVFCHGDCHTWNFVFKYGNGDRNVIQDFKIIDFQLSYVASPVADLYYLLGFCTTKQLRKKCYDYFIDLHYNTMSDTLQCFNMELQDIYPREEYKKELKQMAIIEIVVATQSFLIAAVNPDNKPSLGELVYATAKDEHFLSGPAHEKISVWINELIEDILTRHRFSK